MGKAKTLTERWVLDSLICGYIEIPKLIHGTDSAIRKMISGDFETVKFTLDKLIKEGQRLFEMVKETEDIKSWAMNMEKACYFAYNTIRFWESVLSPLEKVLKDAAVIRGNKSVARNIIKFNTWDGPPKKE